MLPLRSTIALLLSAALAACVERPAPTAGSATSFDFTNGPASPGNSGIFRSEGITFAVAVDEAAGLVSVHGLAPSVAEFCAGHGTFDLGPQQVHEIDAGAVVGLVFDRETPVEIFPLAIFTGRVCRSFRSVTPLDRGVATFHRTDNNFTPTGTEGGRADSFGWTSQGILAAMGGGQVRYSEEVRLLINPQTDELTVKVSNIRVTPMR